MESKIDVLQSILEDNCYKLSQHLEINEFKICEMIVNSVKEGESLKQFMINAVNKSIVLLNFHKNEIN
jgi:hypothetical protein